MTRGLLVIIMDNDKLIHLYYVTWCLYVRWTAGVSTLSNKLQYGLRTQGQCSGVITITTLWSQSHRKFVGRTEKMCVCVCASFVCNKAYDRIITQLFCQEEVAKISYLLYFWDEMFKLSSKHKDIFCAVKFDQLFPHQCITITKGFKLSFFCFSIRNNLIWTSKMYSVCNSGKGNILVPPRTNEGALKRTRMHI